MFSDRPSIPGRSAPLLQFTHGNLRTLEMELLFDTYEELRDVRAETLKLTGLTAIAYCRRRRNPG